MTDADYKELIKRAAADEPTFIRLTLSGRGTGGRIRPPVAPDDTPWVKIVVRPVLIKGERRLQFSYFDPKKDVTKNFSPGEAAAKLDYALAMPFGHIDVQTTAGDIHVKITRKGKVLVTRAKPSSTEGPTLAHDRPKRHALAAGVPDDFLEAVGITGKNGRILPGMHGKFAQVNEFLKIIEEELKAVRLAPILCGTGAPACAESRPAEAAGPHRRAESRPAEAAGPHLSVVDCGCGSAYLTFAAYHYLKHVRGIDAAVVGVDSSEELVAKCAKLRDSLGWPGPEFRASSIAAFTPERPPDVVLSLHACDTATDEAIAKGILWESRVILAAPCCQHELHHRLHAPTFQPVLRHGVLRERMADLLTDALRALVLRIMGYRADVIEFISPEHTSKNLMVRAEKALSPGDASSVAEYRALKDYWKVEPAIERLLGEPFARFLALK